MTTVTIDFSKTQPADALNMDHATLTAYLNWMESENKRLQAEKLAAETAAQTNSSFSIKIGRSGTVSVSGFGRYGVSLYTSQWGQLIPLIPAVKRFMTAYAEPIKAQVEVAKAHLDSGKKIEDLENTFKPLKLKIDSEFKIHTV